MVSVKDQESHTELASRKGGFQQAFQQNVPGSEMDGVSILFPRNRLRGSGVPTGVTGYWAKMISLVGTQITSVPQQLSQES